MSSTKRFFLSISSLCLALLLMPTTYVLWAQTRAAPDQLRITAVPSPLPKVQADAFKVSCTTPISYCVGASPIKVFQGSKPIHSIDFIAVFRNGMALTENLDYTRSARIDDTSKIAVTLTLQPVSDGDNILLIYFAQ